MCNVLFPFNQGENLSLLSGAVAALTAYYSKSCNQVGKLFYYLLNQLGYDPFNLR